MATPAPCMATAPAHVTVDSLLMTNDPPGSGQRSTIYNKMAAPAHHAASAVHQEITINSCPRNELDIRLFPLDLEPRPLGAR